MPENQNANKTMNIIMDGRVACIPRDDVIYMVDIVHSLSSDEPYKSFDGGYRKMKLGSKEYLLPRGVEACSTQQFNEMRRRYVYIRNLFNLLKKEKFSFSQDAQNYLALGCHVNSGGSDKASVAIMTCTMRALLLEMGIPESIITNEMIAKSFPSRSTMKNLEFRLGADCSIMVCYEIDINNVSHISWTVDHGNRGDVNHFPKQISFGSRDNENNPVIRAYCFDANGAGHKARESADAIVITAELIDILVPGLVHDSATSDSGGGGAIQYLLPLLQEMGMMSADARKNHCDLHLMNKAAERAKTEISKR